MKFLTTLCLLFGVSSLFSQIPNADFENWSFNGWNYTPDNWETENTELQEPVTQDLDSYQGDYAGTRHSLCSGKIWGSES